MSVHLDVYEVFIAQVSQTFSSQPPFGTHPCFLIPMAHPVAQPLMHFLEPLLALERQIQIVQSTLEHFTEMHDFLEDQNLTATAHALQAIIISLQDLHVQLRLARQDAAVQILLQILLRPEHWNRYLH